MARTINKVAGIQMQSIEYFKYSRLSSLPELEKKIRSQHDSTFLLYPVDELEKAIDIFKKKVSEVYEDVNRILWYDENVLFVIRKGNGSC
jgi:hypothetical protein